MEKDSVKVALVLASIFVASFVIALFLISNAEPTWRNYSIPSFEGMTDVYSLGPAPNSFNVSLNRAIIVDEFRPMNVSGLYLTPPVLLSETAQNYGLASVHAIFVPAKLLKPGTLYNVSAYIMGEHVAWSFTTTSASTCSFGFIEFNQEALYTSLAVAIAVKAATALIIKLVVSQRNAHASSKSSGSLAT